MISILFVITDKYAEKVDAIMHFIDKDLLKLETAIKENKVPTECTCFLFQQIFHKFMNVY